MTTSGPNKDASREALRRLGADVTVVPDESKPRLVFFEELEHRTAMHVVFPATPWWYVFWFGRRPPRAWTVVGNGTCWYVADVGRNGAYTWDAHRGRVGPQTSAIYATLWVNREKVVERRER